jgi:BclB C-terminal domain-containing protein
MTAVNGELLNTSSAIGFGSNLPGITITGGTINLAGLPNYAFSMPRNGTITSLAAFLRISAAINLPASSVTVTAQLYESTTPNDTFTAVPGAVVTLAPPLTGVIPIGTFLSGVTEGLNIPVTAGTRLLLIFTAEVTSGAEVAVAIVGYASAGLGIA